MSINGEHVVFAILNLNSFIYIMQLYSRVNTTVTAG